MKVGKIEISQDIIKGICLNEIDFYKKTNFFTVFIPLRIGENFIKKTNIYTCHSELFEEVIQGDKIPSYNVFIKDDGFKVDKLDYDLD